jgi:hypothetical protein
MREHAHGVKESLNLVSFHAASGDAVLRIAFAH